MEVSLDASDKLDLGIDVNKFNRFITYNGSLTTPPCTKDVKWFLATNKLEMSKNQLESFALLFGRSENVRGLFELGKRKLTLN